MEKREKEPITQFVKRTDFVAKLRAALEDVEQGQAFAIFEGLQKRGSCTVSIIFDGIVARLAPVEVRPVRPEVRAKVEALPKAEQLPEKIPEKERKKNK